MQSLAEDKAKESPICLRDLSALESLNELCPNCGNFVDSLNDITGFCGSCSPNGVGVLNEKAPQPSRLHNWLNRYADQIEATMVAENKSAKVVIREIAQNNKAVCLICGNNIDHGTKDRHQICTKNTKCRKARRYYSYLKYEKGVDTSEALERAVAKFKE